jgi:hypothetical protein
MIVNWRFQSRTWASLLADITQFAWLIGDLKRNSIHLSELPKHGIAKNCHPIEGWVRERGHPPARSVVLMMGKRKNVQS